MRLRRETGDFQITINSENAVNTIRKGLSAEDFVGELVNVNGTYEVVNETGAEFKTNSFTLTYTKATGVITAQEGGSGSGSGGGSGIAINVDLPGGNIEPLPIGLGISDFKNATFLLSVNQQLIGYVPALGATSTQVDGTIRIFMPNFENMMSGEATPLLLVSYNPETGELAFPTTQNPDPGDA